MRIRNILLTLLLAGSTGCATHAYLTTESPPPARQEVVASRPGHVWVEGHWSRTGNHWAWVRGHHVRERPGYVWTGGRWDRRPQGYVWIEGGWRAQGGIVVRRR